MRRPGWLNRRYWRHAPVIRWFMYAAPARCLSCGHRRAHDPDCYFAPWPT